MRRLRRPRRSRSIMRLIIQLYSGDWAALYIGTFDIDKSGQLRFSMQITLPLCGDITNGWYDITSRHIEPAHWPLDYMSWPELRNA